MITSSLARFRAFHIVAELLVMPVVAGAQTSVRELPRVHVIATGGTIAGGAGGPLDAAGLVALIPGVANVARVSVENFSNIDSSRMTPDLQLKLGTRVNTLLRDDPGLAGVVITHGTDSLEESAYLLDLIVDQERPVVFAAAQRPPRERDSDGPRNLLGAVRIAASQVARGLGVLVTLNEQFHAARSVRKTHAIALDAFQSPGAGPVGVIDGEHVIVLRQTPKRLTFDARSVESRVDLLTLVAGGDGHLVDAAVAAGSRGLVIETFGRGNVPPMVTEAVRRARAAGVIVTYTTRTRGGRVEVDDEAKQMGVIGANDLDGLKARVLLVVALAQTTDIAKLQEYFDRASGLR